MRRGKPQQQLYRPGSGPLRKSSGNTDFDAQQANNSQPILQRTSKCAEDLDTIKHFINLTLDDNNAKKKTKKPEQEFYVPKPVVAQTRENNNESIVDPAEKLVMDKNINGDNSVKNDKGAYGKSTRNFSRRKYDDDTNDNDKKGSNTRQSSEPRGHTRNGNNFNRNRDIRSVETTINNPQQDLSNRNMNPAPTNIINFPQQDNTVIREHMEQTDKKIIDRNSRPLRVDNKDNRNVHKGINQTSSVSSETNVSYGQNRNNRDTSNMAKYPARDNRETRSTIRDSRESGDYNRHIKEPDKDLRERFSADYKGFTGDRGLRDTRSSNRDFHEWDRGYNPRDGRSSSNKPPSGRRHSTIGMEQAQAMKMLNLAPRFQRLEKERRAAEAAKNSGQKNPIAEDWDGASLTFQGSHSSTSTVHQPQSVVDHPYDNSGFVSMPTSVSTTFSSLSASSSSSVSQQHTPNQQLPFSASNTLSSIDPLIYHTLPNPGKGRGRGRFLPQHLDTSRLLNANASNEGAFSANASPINSRPTTPMGTGYMTSNHPPYSLPQTDYHPSQTPLEQPFNPQQQQHHQPPTYQHHDTKLSGFYAHNDKANSSGYHQQQQNSDQHQGTRLSQDSRQQRTYGGYPGEYQHRDQRNHGERHNDDRARSTESLNEKTGRYDNRGPNRGYYNKGYGRRDRYEDSNRDSTRNENQYSVTQSSSSKPENKQVEYPADISNEAKFQQLSSSLSASNTTESQSLKSMQSNKNFDWSEDVDQENPLYPEGDTETSDVAMTRSSSTTSLMENSTASLPPCTTDKGHKRVKNRGKNRYRRRSQSRDTPNRDYNYHSGQQGQDNKPHDNRSRQPDVFKVPHEPARGRGDQNRRSVESSETRMTPDRNLGRSDGQSREWYDSSRSFTSRSRDREPSSEQEPLSWRSEMRNSCGSYESRSRQNSERSRTNSERSNYSVEIVRGDRSGGDDKNSRVITRNKQTISESPPTSTKRWDNIDSTTPKQAGVLILNQSPSVTTVQPLTSPGLACNRPPVLNMTNITGTGASGVSVSLRDLGGRSGGRTAAGGQKSLFDPNNPSKPIIVHKPTSSARGNAPGFQEGADALPQIELTTDQYGNIRPQWYDPDSDSFKSARFPDMLCDIGRADTGLQHILYSGRTLVAWDDVTIFRAFLKCALEYLLREDLRFAESQNVDQHFWKLLYYNVIEMARKAMAACADQSKEQFRVFLLNLIEEGCSFYEHLVGQLEKTYAFKVSDAIVGVAKDAKYVGLALISVQKCYIFLGDLLRYKEQVNDGSNYGKSRQYYLKAHELNPKNGRPFSQLAVLAVYARRKLDAVYYYMRSLMSSNPVQSSREALISLLDENRKKYEQTECKRREERSQRQRQYMKQKESEQVRTAPNSLRKETWIRPDDGKRVHRTTSTLPEKKSGDSDEDDLENLSSAELNKRFITSYLHVHGKLITRIGMETFHETALQMLKEFRVLLQHTPVALPCNRFLQLLALNMFAIDNTELKDKQYEVGYRSEQQERALVISLQMFNVILTRCISILHEHVRQSLTTPISPNPPRVTKAAPATSTTAPISLAALSASATIGPTTGRWLLDPATLPQDAQVLLPAVKVWSDWMLCHTNVWNPPPNTQDYNVGFGDIWNRLAALVNLLQKLDQSLAAEFCNEMKDGYYKIRLPEDAVLSGFTPLMYHVPQSKFAAVQHDSETAGSVHRVGLLTFFGTHFLCGLDPPVLEMVMEDDRCVYKSVVAAGRVGDVVRGSRAGSGPSTPPELNDENDIVLEISDEEDFSATKQDGADMPAGNDTSIEVLNLLSRKVELEKQHRSQELYRQKVQKILQQSVVSVHIEVKPKYIIPDTNCFIDYLDLLKRLVECNVYILMVSLVVLSELEGLSKGPASHQHLAAMKVTSLEHTLKVSELAKCALDYLLIKHPNVKCITTKGTILTSSVFTMEDDSVAAMSNDDKILATCLCLGGKGNRDQQTEGPRKLFRDVVLVTDDRNLRVKALARDVPVRELPDFIKWAGLG